MSGSPTAPGPDPGLVVDEVAEAVGLAEGPAGVLDVVRTVARLEPVAVRRISRATELPVPFVSAICNELRRRGVIGHERPVRLTPRGREAFGALARRRLVDPDCAACGGRGLIVPDELAATVRRLAVVAGQAPAANVELDQAHCTVETKVRRVLALDEAGALDGKRVLVLGDDDLVSVALRLLAERHGIGAGIRSLVVVELDGRLRAFLRQRLRGAPFATEVVEHDLREPLPDRLRATADTVFTDPPYTTAGASLFVSRAAQAAAGPGADVFLCFGPRRPDETLAVQRAIAGMGLTVQRLARNFNDYLGAGALGGTSHLYHLAATAELRPLVAGRHEGALYTADVRPPRRNFRCRACGAVERVGRGQAWTTIGALRAAGCPRCGGTAFAPLSRGRRPASRS